VPARSPAAVTLPDGRLMVLGGGTNCYQWSNCSVHNTVQIYDPKTRIWSIAAPMIHARMAFAAVVGPDHRVYAIGGWDGQSALSSVEAYDVRGNSWSTCANLPLSVAEESAVVVRHHIVVIGGDNASGGQSFGTLFVLNNHGWVGGASMPTPRGALGVAVGPAGRIYAIGGYSAGYLATVEVYDPQTNRWSSGPTLPMAVAQPEVTSVGGRIYAIGGWNGSAVSQVAVFGPQNKSGHNPFSGCGC